MARSRAPILAACLAVATTLSSAEVVRENNYLPPAFVAEKFGLNMGDKVDTDLAQQIADEAQEVGTKAPNFFKVADDELLMLPEVFSNLRVEDVSRDFAHEEDAEDALKLRNSRWWGRLYIDGWPQTIQYLRAHFGDSPPQGVRRILLAEPLDACEALRNKASDVKDAIVLAKRGSCTFGSKGKIVEASGAAALVIINNEDGNHHVPGPDAHELPLSVAMIPRDEGNLLVSSIESGTSLTGAMVPIHCTAKSKVMKDSELCKAATVEDRRLTRNVLEGGWFTTPSGEKFEFLVATFGVRVPTGKPIKLNRADPEDACQPLSDSTSAKNTALLIPRGGCSFIEKAEHGSAANASMVIISNTVTALDRVGVEPRWRGLAIDVPIIMVTDAAGQVLSTLASQGGEISFTLSRSVNKATWLQIDKYRNGDEWPKQDEKREALLQDLLQEHSGWPERLAAIEEGVEIARSHPSAKRKAHREL